PARPWPKDHLTRPRRSHGWPLAGAFTFVLLEYSRSSFSMSKETTSPGDRAIARIYERDMDLVLVEELESSAEFCTWLVTRVYGRDCYVRSLGTRHSV